jgi:HK97 family phage prohead protease
MSTTAETVPVTEDDARTNVLVREFAAELTAGEGRTVDVRIVPYGERITHNDGLGGVPRGVDYQEEWLPGVFAHQLNAANRVHANFEHQQGVAGIVGHGLALREAGDGFHGSFVLHETAAGDTTLALVKAGALEGVSLEAVPVKNIKLGGVIQRAKANLRAVAFTRFGAYSGARVLAVREEASTFDAALLPVDMDPELVARCRALGLKMPQHYEAHPDATGTPDESGTPDGSAPATPETIGTQSEV